MTNLAKLSKLTKQRKSSLPAPPPIEEASPNLAAPEHAPHAPHAPATPNSARVDGRTLRKTNRTVQFATRVTEEFDARIRAIAQRDGKLLVKILEEALDAYETAR